jgi:hypothetical protein
MQMAPLSLDITGFSHGGIPCISIINVLYDHTMIPYT